MSGIRLCRVCGVPMTFSKDYKWNSDGTTTMASDPDLRNVFIEAEGIDRLFHNINNLLGTDITRIIAEGKRKFSHDYLSGMFSGPKGAVIRLLLRRQVYKMISSISPVTGYGDFTLMDYRRGEYVKVRGRNIYCLPLLMGDMQAVFEVVEGKPGAVSIAEDGDGYILEITPGEEVELDLKSRLELVPQQRKAGEINYHRCPECNLPLDFREFEWDFEEGTITDRNSGRNMALISLESLRIVFGELESELGEDIPRTIMEAQRLYIRDAFTPAELESREDYISHQLALRGMGNLVELDTGVESMDIRVENGSPPPMVAGFLQGVFELLTGKDSLCSYELGGDGTLSVAVKSV